MFLRRMLSQCFLPVALLAWPTALIGGEAPPKAKAGDIGDLVDRIPLGQLEDGVVLQAGDVKIGLAAVAKVETAYVAAGRRRDPKYSLTPEHQTAFRKTIALQLFRNALLEKYAADNKLDMPDDKFEARFDKFKQTAKEHGVSYEQFLADNGLTDADLRRYWRAKLACEDKVGETVSEEELTKATNAMQEQAALRRVSHILFMYKGGERAPADITRTKEEAKAAAEDIIKKLKSGEDFAKLAKEYSDCPSKSKGGDLNFFPRKGAMVQPFSDAAYGLEKVGDFTQTPVETPFGFHVIKLTDIRGAADLNAATKERLVNEKLNKQVQQLIEEAAAQAKFNAKVFEK